LVVICATLENHDRANGNENKQGILAKVYNIQTGLWLTASPFNVNQVSTGAQKKSAIVALTGLKFMIAFSTKEDLVGIKTRIWTPVSSDNINTNSWMATPEELVNTVNGSGDKQFGLKWLKMPKESKVLLTWFHDSSQTNKQIWGQFYNVVTGAKIGTDFILIER
jgi:hypothetical protein